MAIAETARLLASLELQDKGFTSTAARATGSLTALERASVSSGGSFGLLQRGFGVVGRAASGVEGAVAHLGGRLRGLLTGPLGVLGLGAGLLSVGGFIGTALTKTSTFALALEKLTGITGESAQSMGELILVTERFGITSDRLAQIVGFTEKTLGRLSETTTKGAVTQKQIGAAQESVVRASERLRVAQLALGALEARSSVSAASLAAARFRVRDATAALATAEGTLAQKRTQFAVSEDKLSGLEKEFGVHLEDARGKALSFSQILNNVADYYTSNASAAQKADLASRIFGRGYAVLIPVLQLGSKGIKDAKQAIDELGLSLGTDTQGALQAYKASLRQVGEAVNVLEIGVGLGLAPTITKFANSLTLWLESGGSKQIITFFTNLGGVAQHAVDIFANQVIPTLGSIYGYWNAIPEDVRNFLIRGLVADRTIKFLLGFSPVGLGLKIGAAMLGPLVGGIGGALKGLLGIGSKAVPQVIGPYVGEPIPVFVTNPGFGLPGGKPGVPTPVAPSVAERFAPTLGGLGELTLLGLAGAAASVAALALPLISPYLFQGPSSTGTINDPRRTVLPGAGGNGAPGVVPAGFGAQFTGLMPSFAALRGSVDANTAAVKTGTGAHATNTVAVNKAQDAQRAALIKSERQDKVVKPPPPVVTAAQFLAELIKLPFIGTTARASIFERISTAPKGTRDPFGGRFENLVELLKNPKAPAVSFEISGHLRELRSLEAYYIAHGDVQAALKVQGVINRVDYLIGITAQDHTADLAQAKAIQTTEDRGHAKTHTGLLQNADITKSLRSGIAGVHSSITTTAARTHSHLARLAGIENSVDANAAAIARKNFSPKITVDVGVTTSVSISNVERTITRDRVLTGTGFQPGYNY